MINYRQIFNPNYTLIGLIITLTLIILLALTNKDIITTIRQVSKTTLTASIITIIISFFLKLLITLIIPSNYQIIIEVISTNFTKSLITTSLILTFTSVLLLILLKILKKLQPITK